MQFKSCKERRPGNETMFVHVFVYFLQRCGQEAVETN